MKKYFCILDIIFFVFISEVFAVEIYTGYNSNSNFLKDNYVLYSWGFNGYGQLCNGITDNVYLPSKLNLSDVKQVYTNTNSAVILKTDGTVWGIGLNNYGQLGTDNTINQLSLAKVNIEKIKTIAFSGAHSLAVQNNGDLYSWGFNNYGQLGTGDTINKLSPVKVMSNVMSAACGSFSSIVLKNDGTVWSFGQGKYGQLGLGNSNSVLPLQIQNLDNVIAVSAGIYHVLALKSDKTVWGFGFNSSGQLGSGDTGNKFYPTQCKISDVKSISAGGYFTIFLKQDGTVWSCGNNNYGKLGNNSTINELTPVKIENFNANMVVAGLDHVVSVKEDKSVWAWGRNSYGQLGNNTTDQSLIPTKVSISFQVDCIPIAEHEQAIQAKNAIIQTKDEEIKKLNQTINNIDQVFELLKSDLNINLKSEYDIPGKNSLEKLNMLINALTLYNYRLPIYKDVNKLTVNHEFKSIAAATTTAILQNHNHTECLSVEEHNNEINAKNIVIQTKDDEIKKLNQIITSFELSFDVLLKDIKSKLGNLAFNVNGADFAYKLLNIITAIKNSNYKTKLYQGIINIPAIRNQALFTINIKVTPAVYQNAQRWYLYLSVESANKYTCNMFPANAVIKQNIINNDLSFFDSIHKVSDIKYCAGESCDTSKKSITMTFDEDKYEKAVCMGYKIATYIINIIHKISPDLVCEINMNKIPLYRKTNSGYVKPKNFEFKKEKICNELY